MEGETPKRVNVLFELTLAMKKRGQAQLDEPRTSAAMSGKVGAMVSLSGCGRGSCRGALNSLAAAGREEGLEAEQGVAQEEEEEGGVGIEVTPWGENFFFLLDGGAATRA